MRKVVKFKIKEEFYALDSMRVDSISDYMVPNYIPNVGKYTKGTINLRGAIIPIKDLREILDYTDNKRDSRQIAKDKEFGKPVDENEIGYKLNIIIVENKDGGKIGFIIDEVTAVTDIDDKDIQKIEDIGIEKQSKTIESVALQGKDTISILNIDKLFEM